MRISDWSSDVCSSDLVERQAVAAARLPLDGAKAADPARDAFVERYLRRGIDAGVEMKSLSGASGAEGGYAVPREIDGSIAATLTSLSPIRGIATVVQTGTSGYRNLIATGATGAGRVGEPARSGRAARRVRVCPGVEIPVGDDSKNN